MSQRKYHRHHCLWLCHYILSKSARKNIVAKPVLSSTKHLSLVRKFVSNLPLVKVGPNRVRKMGNQNDQRFGVAAKIRAVNQLQPGAPRLNLRQSHRQLTHGRNEASERPLHSPALAN
jgi:hypothetical protein